MGHRLLTLFDGQIKTAHQRLTRGTKRTLLVASGLTLALPFLAPFTAIASPTVTEYPITTSGFIPNQIVAGPDGALWFTERFSYGNVIGRITTSGSKNEAQVTLPSGDVVPTMITGPDGALWFEMATSSAQYYIVRMTTDGTITNEYPVTTSGDSFGQMINGPDGNIWFILAGNSGSFSKIVRITPSGTITYRSLSLNIIPTSLTFGADGNIWFTDDGFNKIGRLTADLTNVTEYSLPSGTVPAEILSGPDGNLWFDDGSSRAIYLMSTTGTIVNTFHTPSSPSLGASSLVFGPDGNLWFTEFQGNIGRMTTSGAVTEYPVTTSTSDLGSIVLGPDGAFWFVEQNYSHQAGNNIGRITMPTPSAPSLTANTPTTTSPSLSWSTVSGAATYNIYRDGTDIDSVTSTSYVDNSAGQGTHSYYVTAVNSGGESSPSNTVNVAYDSTLPLISYFTVNDGSTFNRHTAQSSSGVSTQTINSDGSVTASVNSAPGYADSGFTTWSGKLSDLPNFTVNSSSGDFALNLWFDANNDGSFFQWDSSGNLTGLGGDTYGLSSGSSGGTLSVDGSTSFFMMDDGQNYTLSQLIAGDDTTSGINADTPVTVWVGVDVGNGGSTSATISSISGL